MRNDGDFWNKLIVQVVLKELPICFIEVFALGSVVDRANNLISQSDTDGKVVTANLRVGD